VRTVEEIAAVMGLALTGHPCPRCGAAVKSLSVQWTVWHCGTFHGRHDAVTLLEADYKPDVFQSLECKRRSNSAPIAAHAAGETR
jgi:hypothetical protein